MKVFFVSLLKFSFAGLVFYFLFKSDKISVEDLSLLLNPQLFLSLLTCLILVNIVATFRWQSILQSQGMNSGFWSTFKLTLIGAFFNFAIPGGVGGDVVKAFYFVRTQPEKKVAASLTVVMDRVIGVTVMAVAGFLALLSHYDLVFEKVEARLLFFFLSALVLCFTLLWSLVFSKSLQALFLRIISPVLQSKKMDHLIQTILSFSSMKSCITKAVLLSIASQALFCVAFYFISVATQSGHSWDAIIFAVPVGMILSAVPITPAGIGVGQIVFYFLFNLTSPVSTFGTTAATMIQAMTFLVSLSGAWFYLTVKKHH